jgi:hypothetical protein
LLLNMDSFQQKVQLIVLEAFKYIFSIENWMILYCIPTLRLFFASIKSN